MIKPKEGRSEVGWNRSVLIGLSILLVLAGVLGFVIPPDRAFTSGAAPYNIFHIVFGLAGAALAISGQGRYMALFNLGFGLIDLYQAVAGITGLFPSGFFQLKPGDHIIHVVLGLFLALVGAHGLLVGGTASPARAATN